MSFEQAKEQLLKTIPKILSREYVQADTEIVQRLEELQTDIEKDFFTVVILGEFKRGKSTFVNALLGEDILPTDILPTTATINALMYSADKKIEIVKNDGKSIAGPFSKEFLNQFSADGTGDTSDIQFIKIGCPAAILENNTVIVDTPGVSDINEQRVQVTYDFIPKANAVIFLLDATAPLKQSEKEFIEQHLLRDAIDKILFVANKYDYIDEEEDGEALKAIQYRITKAFEKKVSPEVLQQIHVLLLSAQWALDGILQQDDELIDDSGIRDVKQAMQHIIFDGSVSKNKIQRYTHRLESILQQLKRTIHNKIEIQQTSQHELEEIIQNLHKMEDDYQDNAQCVDGYIKEQKQTILAMVDKSLVTFHRKLKENISDQVEGYNGSDFKDFVELQINKSLKRNMEAWVESYSPHIDTLLMNLEKNVAQGLAQYFQQQVSIQSGMQLGSVTTRKFNFQLDGEDVSTATIQAGAITAGGAGLIMLIGGPVLMPFIGFLAYPFLQKKFLKDKLAAAKSQLMPMLNEQLIQSMCVLQNEVHKTIDDRVMDIQKATNETYLQLIRKSKDQIEDVIQQRKKENDTIQDTVNVLTQQIESIDETVQAVRRITL